MSKPGNTGLRRIVNATFYSLAGLRTVWRSEAAFRQECALVVVLIPLACWLDANAVERSLLIGTCLIVLIVELLNTAVEYVVDRIGPEPDGGARAGDGDDLSRLHAAGAEDDLRLSLRARRHRPEHRSNGPLPARAQLTR